MTLNERPDKNSFKHFRHTRQSDLNDISLRKLAFLSIQIIGCDSVVNHFSDRANWWKYKWNCSWHEKIALFFGSSKKNANSFSDLNELRQLLHGWCNAIHFPSSTTSIYILIHWLDYQDTVTISLPNSIVNTSLNDDDRKTIDSL